jgi:parvulin-like peptidyl-prolyl isomerase
MRGTSSVGIAIVACIAVACAFAWTATVGAQNPENAPKAADPAQAAKSDLPPVAVYVNGEPIFVAELLHNYENIAEARQLSEGRADRSKAELLDQLINRRLAIQAIERIGTLVSGQELNERMKNLEAQLRQQKMTPEQFARARGVNLDTVRKDIIWELGWDRYLERKLADALEQYFNEHKKDLDGTQIRVSHILLRPEKFSDAQPQITARAVKLREAITAGKISFQDAAKKYSAGPSGDYGGDLGFIARRGAMTEEFSKAAFALDVGQISEPVNSAFGTHLITVTEVKPGTKQWTQVIPEIRTLASADVLEELSILERKKAKIEFTGKTPYFKLDDQQLVVPPKEPQQAAQK